MSLVDDTLSLRPQCVLVPRPVMPAELKISATGQYDADVGLCATAIAAIGCAQLGGRQRRGHGTSIRSGRDAPVGTVLHDLTCSAWATPRASPQAKFPRNREAKR